MNLKRRTFISQASIGAIALAGARPLRHAASLNGDRGNDPSNREITIYHTNDLNGNIYSAMNAAGLKKVKMVIKKERGSGLIFDAGNFLSVGNSDQQNLSVIALMNTMGYFAATPGKNELGLGQENLAKLIPAMDFSLVNCNYTFGGVLSGKIQRFITKQHGALKIGITGVGPEIKGVTFNDPVQCVNAIAEELKAKEKCDLVICLSQLGFSKDAMDADSQKLGKLSQDIDFIVSGNHSDDVTSPLIVLNKNKREVFISQLAPDGVMLGKTRLGFGVMNERKSFHIKNIAVA